ncbi:MAG: class I mannose-6-phosphate isomerase [Verrucomicrobia bacterium]|nr:class I mannose-6-phosphate isomerase [Verrucomicrobiota bacterium]
MKTDLYPLLFTPVYKDYIWGGNDIAKTFKRDTGMPRCAESWELADRPEGMSMVSNGPLQGISLQELIVDRSPEILGYAAETFPLLVKLIDAGERLSVQVHPNDESAKRHGGEAKTEMWYILAANPGACVYAGLKAHTTAAKFKKAIADGNVEKVLETFNVAPGDVVYMPGGRVHAIGAGCLLLEVQQNSNTTYRVYDWGRVGPDGRPRQLHIEQALKVIDWRQGKPAVTRPVAQAVTKGNSRETILHCDYFEMERIILEQRETASPTAGGCDILFIPTASVRITANKQSQIAPPGTTVLIPAALKTYRMEPLDADADIIRISPGR